MRPTDTNEPAMPVNAAFRVSQLIEGAYILSLVTPTDTSTALALIGIPMLNVHLV